MPCIWGANTSYTNGSGHWLFDIEADPYETSDLSRSHPEVGLCLDWFLLNIIETITIIITINNININIDITTIIMMIMIIIIELVYYYYY